VAARFRSEWLRAACGGRGDIDASAATTPNGEDLQVLAGMIEAGTITPVIDRCYPLGDAGEALRHLESGHAHGKSS
jgi:NADPH:quinone reductase-like Zn-dependent oxidoreductase